MQRTVDAVLFSYAELFDAIFPPSGGSARFYNKEGIAMLYKDIVLNQLDRKHSAWNEQIRKMAGLDYDTYAKLAIGLLAELKGYISAMCDTVLGLYNAEAMDAQEADYLIKQILKVSYNVTDAVRLTASTCHAETTDDSIEERGVN